MIIEPYIIRKAVMPADISAPWDSEFWHNAYTLKLQHIFRESSSHRPLTKVKVQYDDNFIYGLFQVEDYFVAARHQVDQEQVCEDSCVEFFVQPAGKEYINFEINCSGTILAYFISDWYRDPVKHSIAKYEAFKEEDFKQLSIYHTLSGQIEGITDPVKWSLGLQIPLTLLQKFYPGLKLEAGAVWRANFYKCGGMAGYDHWLTWSPIVGELNFHLPQFFSDLKFV
jgi:hypothetical protein